ncbi:Putative inner membrane protein [plant metagenome]|uniref:Inner membrane protein n=1 Tax=plant metagenome TaxID=1297885 RepID=A0A484TAE5_9ZZZZ
MSDSVPFYRRFPRLTTWLIAAAVLGAILAIIAPAQLPVVAYKMSLVLLAGVAGYWLDRTLFPYARPADFLVQDWRCGPWKGPARVHHPVADGYELVFAAAMLRRAVVVAAVVLAVALGL